MLIAHFIDDDTMGYGKYDCANKNVYYFLFLEFKHKNDGNRRASIIFSFYFLALT